MKLLNGWIVAAAGFGLILASGCKKEDVEAAKAKAESSMEKAKDSAAQGVENAKNVANDAGKTLGEKANAAGEGAKDMLDNAKEKAKEKMDAVAPTVEEWSKLANEKFAGLKDKFAGLGLSMPTLTGDKDKDKSALSGLLTAIQTQLKALEKVPSNISIPGVQAPSAGDIEKKRSGLQEIAAMIQPILDQMGAGK